MTAPHPIPISVANASDPFLVDAVAQRCSIRILACDLAAASGLTADEAIRALVEAPANLLTLLYTPHGWLALGQYAAGTFGCSSQSYCPTVH